MLVEYLLDVKGVLALVIGICVSVLLWRRKHSSAVFPPGPKSYPIIGSMLALGKSGDIIKKFREFHAQYGELFTFRFGSQTSVVVSGYENLKEVFLKMGDKTSDRPGTFLFKDIAGEGGLVAPSGHLWKTQRTFTLTTLREFGFGKKSVASRIQEEVTVFLHEIENKNGEPFDIDQLVKTCVANVICSMAFGQRFEFDDVKFIKLVRYLDDNMRRMTPAIAIFPFLRYIPGDPFGFQIFLKNLASLRQFFAEFIVEHQGTFDENNIRDYIDAFLLEMKRQKDDPDTTFTREIHVEENCLCPSINERYVQGYCPAFSYTFLQLRRSIGDLFAAGSETTATTIKWAILYMVHYPDYQEKLKQEIDAVIGTSRTPCINDRPNLPYCEAFITEIQRCCNILPLGVQHSTSAEIRYKEFVIPKGTILLANLDSVLSDPDIFENPQEFNPSRFINEKGEFAGSEKVVAFSIGRRVCLGESLARSELFLFISSLVQRFHMEPEDSEKLPSLEGHLGITHAPKAFRCKAVLRS